MKSSRQRMVKAEGLTRRKLLASGAAAGAIAVADPLEIATPAVAQSAPLKVGVLTPMSGGMASLGNNKVNGIKMFFAEKDYKVAGRTVALIIEDDEFKPQEGLRKARKLVEQDNVDILLGVLSSAIGYAMKEYAARARKVWITTGAAADGIFKKANNTPYAFRASLSTWQANAPMGTWLAEKGFRRVFVTGSDYAMGREAVDGFEQSFKLKGGMRAGEIYAPLGTADFAPYLAAIKSANADLVYATYAGSEAVRFVQQFAAFGLKGPLRLAGYGYLVEEDVLEAEKEAAEGVYSGLNWGYGLDTPANQAFVTNFRKQFNAVPTVDAVAGYVGAQVVWEAFNKLDGKIPSQLALSDAILATKIDTPRGPISFDPETRNVVQNIEMVAGLGFDVRLLFTAVFAFGAALAGMAGTLGAPITGVYPGLDFEVLITTLIVIVVGGLGSITGAFWASILIGMCETFGKALLPEIASFVIFGVMAVVLLVRSWGRHEEEVE